MVLLGRDEIVQSIPELKVLKKVTETSQQIHSSASAGQVELTETWVSILPGILEPDLVLNFALEDRKRRGETCRRELAGLKMKLARFECVIHD